LDVRSFCRQRATGRENVQDLRGIKAWGFVEEKGRGKVDAGTCCKNTLHKDETGRGVG
jgi:hypothetical protein